ncbi:putative membrane protein [Golden Marseillevirus]|uniref:hypothetical protein n=1 Tax=Golden Marseillevirus TaxID=1720526 RepID=UPI000877A957|nr:hypothetical protein GMAR_ORF68 [Golden Marseillevirus]ALX27443.1 putative membrane protein [Golden Marseillevirus]
MALSYFVIACLIWFGVPSSSVVAGIASFGLGYILKQREVSRLEFELRSLKRNISNFSETRSKELIQTE